MDIQERIARVKNSIKITDICPGLKASGSNDCPCCGKRSKFSVWDNTTAKCWSPSCNFNKIQDVFSIYRWKSNLSFKEGFMQALIELEEKAGIKVNYKISTERGEILEKCLKAYTWYLWSRQGKEARDYLIKERGFSEEALKIYQIGFAPHAHCLSEFDIDPKALIKQGLLDKNREYYINRIIFPIKDINNRLVHFIGRHLGAVPTDEKGDELLPRYKDTKKVEGVEDTKSYLAFEETIKDSKKLGYLVVAEGYPDTLSLQQAGIPAVGLLGLEKLSKHSYKFQGFNKIIFLFDNDKYSLSHPVYPGEYKSWRRIIPQLINLQIILSDQELYIYNIPEEKGKDVNDWLSKEKLSPLEIISRLEKSKQELVDYLIEIKGGDIEEHNDLIKLVTATGRGKDKLKKLIPPELDCLAYAMKVIGK